MSPFKKIKYIVKSEGLNGLIWKLKRLMFPKIYNSIIFQSNKSLFTGKLALEIGGPSKFFQKNNMFPIYELFNRVDGCNFSANTVWEGRIIEGETNYKYSNELNGGRQYVNEGSDLSTIPDNSYDFLLSCHSLEHIANPIKALNEWMRVLKPNGYIILILPNPLFTFDHKRPITNIEHLINDYIDKVDETNLDCLEEVLLFHDLERDPLGPKDLSGLKKRILENYENRCLHHHVFNVELINDMFNYSDIKFIKSEFIRPFNIITIGQKK